MKRNFSQELSLVRPRPGDSLRSWTRVTTHKASTHPLLHVPAPNVKGKGFNQLIREAFAPKLLPTHRAAWISPLENIDSQGRLAFQHTPLCHKNRYTCTLTFWVQPRLHRAERFGPLVGNCFPGITTGCRT